MPIPAIPPSAPVKPLVSTSDVDNIYEFAQSYAATGAWNTIQCKLGGMIFGWSQTGPSILAALTMIRDAAKTSAPTAQVGTQIAKSFVLGLTPLSTLNDNQTLWNATAVTIAGSVASVTYASLVIDISRRAATKGRFRVTVNVDSANGLQVLAEYWGPSYT